MPMDFTTYGGLIDAVTELVGRDDLRPLMPGWILAVEKDLRVNLRNSRDNMSSVDANFVVDQDYIDMPADALRPRMLEINTARKRIVDVVSLDKLIDVYNDNLSLAYPFVMTLIGQDRIRLAPIPTTTDGYTLHYWKEEETVDEDKQAQGVLQEQPLLLYYRVAQHAKIRAEDMEMANTYGAIADKLESNYDRFLFRVRFKGGRVRVRPDRQPDDRHRLLGR